MVGRKAADALWRRPRLQLSLLLAGPVGWLLIAYIGSLVVLFVAALWRLDPFSAEIVKSIGFQNFETLWQEDVYRQIAQRTVVIAALVTVDAVDAPELMHVYADKGDWAEGLIPKVVLDPLRKTDQTPAPGQEIDLSELRLQILFHRRISFLSMS